MPVGAEGRHVVDHGLQVDLAGVPLAGAVGELRKLSPPVARNEFTVTENVVAGRSAYR